MSLPTSVKLSSGNFHAIPCDVRGPSMAYLISTHDGYPLYAGASSRCRTRLVQHRADDRFKRLGAVVELHWHKTERAALAHERVLIRTLNPFYNFCGLPPATRKAKEAIWNAAFWCNISSRRLLAARLREHRVYRIFASQAIRRRARK